MSLDTVTVVVVVVVFFFFSLLFANEPIRTQGGGSLPSRRAGSLLNGARQSGSNHR